jgi:hypothetical protein
MTKMVIPGTLLLWYVCSKTFYLAPSPQPVIPSFFTSIFLAIVPPDFSKDDEGREVMLHYFTRILLAIEGKVEEETIIQQEPMTYWI